MRRITVCCVLFGATAWLGFAPLAGGLLDGIKKAAIPQWLGLVQGQSNIVHGFAGQHQVK